MQETLNEQEVARRLQKEHALLQELGENLKAATEDLPARERSAWLKNLKDRYEHFRAHMYRRLALEEVGGFLRVVEERRPTLAPQIEHLREEHAKIVKLLEAVQGELKNAGESDTGFLRECILRIRHILSEVEHHEEHEAMLVEFVVSQDLGGET